MVLLGCTPQSRLTEQHDIFFGIGTSLPDLTDDMYNFWPDGGRLHVDSWREVTQVGEYAISIVPKTATTATKEKLFFLNLGGYRQGEFQEYHYKILVVAKTIEEAIKEAEKTSFYKHFGFKDAESHIDDMYALDVDEMFNVEDILAPHLKQNYSIKISKTNKGYEDILHIGYTKLKEI